MLVLLSFSSTKPGLVATMACFALLFTPENYVLYHSVRIGGQVKAITLVVLLVVSLVYPFQDRISSARSAALPAQA